MVDDVEIERTCAAHTPLWILKQQLAELTGVAPSSQAIVRQTAKDDSELLEDDSLSLDSHGVRCGTILIMTLLRSAADQAPPGPGERSPEQEMAATLRDMPDLATDADAELVAARARRQTHAWLVAEKRKHDLMALARARAASAVGERAIAETEIGPADADHSYSGIVFDVEAKGSTEVVIDAVHVAGMLGEVSIFASGGSWAGRPSNRRSRGRRCGWGQVNDALVKSDFDLVYPESRATPQGRRQGRQQASWDEPVRIQLARPVRILPGGCSAIYIHSSLPDDLGIQYRSTMDPDEVTLENDHLRIMPGVGHTGSRPFDTRRGYGWYRANRTLCGSVEYRQLERVWRVAEHAEFPMPLRAAVFTMLCANQRAGCVLSLLPVELLLALLEAGRLSWDAFPPLPARKRKNRQKVVVVDRAEKRQKHQQAGQAATADPSLELEHDTDTEQELAESSNSRRRKKSRRRPTVTDASSPAVSPAQDPVSTSEAQTETRRVRQRRRGVRVVES